MLPNGARRIGATSMGTMAGDGTGRERGEMVARPFSIDTRQREFASFLIRHRCERERAVAQCEGDAHAGGVDGRGLDAGRKPPMPRQQGEERRRIGFQWRS